MLGYARASLTQPTMLSHLFFKAEKVIAARHVPARRMRRGVLGRVKLDDVKAAFVDVEMDVALLKVGAQCFPHFGVGLPRLHCLPHFPA